MNEDSLDFDLENLPNPLTLRRQNTLCNEDSLNQRFFDTKTHEIFSGHPDLTHSSNKNLVRIIAWQAGQCNPNIFFFSNKDRPDENYGMNPIPMVECTA